MIWNNPVKNLYVVQLNQMLITKKQKNSLDLFSSEFDIHRVNFSTWESLFCDNHVG